MQYEGSYGDRGDTNADRHDSGVKGAREADLFVLTDGACDGGIQSSLLLRYLVRTRRKHGNRAKCEGLQEH